MPEIQRTEKGWKLHFDDGNSTEFSSYKDATQARWNSYEARVLNLNGAVREAIENSERNLTNNQARRFEFDADTMSVSRMKRENPQLTATLDERMEISSFMDDGRAEQQQYAEAVAGNAALSQDRETMEASTLVLGTSSVSFRKGVRVGVSKLYRGFNAASVVEETLETDASHLLKNGKREWMIKALRETEQQTGKQLLPKGVADADLTVLQLKEAYSHVGVSLFAGEAVKGRNGKANPRLSNNRKWLLGVQRSALGRAMNASAQKFAAMFRRAQRLEQARVGVGVREQGDAKPGNGGSNNNSSTLQAELEETLNRSLGLSEGAVVNATENGAIVSTTDVNAEGDVSFSLIAPNGRPSQLTEEQWQAVRTPEFKEQFGDWEAAERREWIEGNPVSSLTGNEFSWSEKPLSQRVNDWFQDKFGGFVNHPILKSVQLIGKGARNSWGHGKSAKKAAAFAAVPDITAKGRIVRWVKDYKGGTTDRVLLAAPVDIGGERHTGIVVLFKDANTQRFYVHEVFTQRGSRTSSTAQTPQREERLVTDAETLSKIADDLRAVNPSTVSKIVDVNSEPLVVYPVGSQGDTGLIFTTDKSRASNEGMLDQPVFLKGFNEGEDFSWDRGSGLITVYSRDQLIPFQPTSNNKTTRETSNEFADAPPRDLGEESLSSELEDALKRKAQTVSRLEAQLPEDYLNVVEALQNGKTASYPGISVRPAAGLDRDSRIVEAAFAHHIAKDPDAARNEYFRLAEDPENFGSRRYVSTDLARMVFPEYASNKEFRTLFDRATLTPAGYVAMGLALPKLYAEGKGKYSSVLFTAGGYSSGKTTASKYILIDKINNAAAIVDSTVSRLASGKRLIQQALDAGFTPEMTFIYRPWTASYKSAVNRLKEEGRPVAVGVTAQAHYEAQKVFLELESIFRGSVGFTIVANDGLLTDIRRESLDYLKKIAYFNNDEHGRKQRELETEYGKYLDQEYQFGNISASEYSAARSGAVSRQSATEISREANRIREGTRQTDATSKGLVGEKSQPSVTDTSADRSAFDSPPNDSHGRYESASSSNREGESPFYVSERTRQIGIQLQPLLDELLTLDENQTKYYYQWARLNERAKKAIEVTSPKRGTLSFKALPAILADNVYSGKSIVERFVSADLLPRDVIVEQVNHRAKAGGKKIQIQITDPPHIVAHELMHSIERQFREVRKAAIRFLEYRTKGDVPIRLKDLFPKGGFRDDEYTLLDKWKEKGGHPYTGKFYKNELGQYTGTEILSTGIERLERNPLKFLQDDPEFFNFVITTLQHVTHE